MGGSLYTTWKDADGVLHTDEAVLRYDLGRVYVEADGFFESFSKGQLLAEYDGGSIYSVKKGSLEKGDVIAVFDDSKICGVKSAVFGESVRSHPIGEAIAGSITDRDKKVLARYDGEDDGGAACAAVLMYDLGYKLSSEGSPAVGFMKSMLSRLGVGSSRGAAGTAKTVLAGIALALTLMLTLALSVFVMPFALIAMIVLVIIAIIKDANKSEDTGEEMTDKKDISVFDNDFFDSSSERDGLESSLDETVKVRRSGSRTSAGSGVTAPGAERKPASAPARFDDISMESPDSTVRVARPGDPRSTATSVRPTVTPPAASASGAGSAYGENIYSGRETPYKKSPDRVLYKAPKEEVPGPTASDVGYTTDTSMERRPAAPASTSSSGSRLISRMSRPTSAGSSHSSSGASPAPASSTPDPKPSSGTEMSGMFKSAGDL